MLNLPSHARSVLVDVTAGQVLDHTAGEACDSLTDFAAISPELFSSGGVSWERLFAVLEAPVGDNAFQDLVLIGDELILIAQRFSAQPRIAMLTIASAKKGVGLALAEAREHVRALSGG